MANYKVVGNKVFANIGKLTEKELKKVKNYKELGYTLVDDDLKEDKDTLKKADIVKYLKENGTKEQQKKFDDIMKEPVIDVETGKQKISDKTKKPITKGFMAAKAWFHKEFPDVSK